MSAIANAKEVFRVISDVARALPVIVAKLPENDDPACLAMVLEAVSYTHLRAHET